MELIYKLDSITHKKKANEDKYTYVYKPTKEILENEITFTLKTDTPISTMKELGLPGKIGDIITMEIKSKNVQKDLK